MRIHEAEYVVFDVETTGLSPASGDRIVEIGAVKLRNGQIVDEWESFVNPERDIPIEATNVNNITNEMVSDAPLSADVMPQFLNFVGGACLCGHNVKFDLEFVCHELSLVSRKFHDQTPAIDTLAMAKRLIPHLNSFRLASLAQSLGVPIKETHRALADVKLTANVLLKLFEFCKKQRIETFAQLFKEFNVQKPNYKIVQPGNPTLF